MAKAKTTPEAAPIPAKKGGARPGAGRMAYAPEHKRRPRSIALTESQWERYKELGTDWLIERLERVRKVPEVPEVRPMSDRGQGQKGHAPEDKRRPSSVALTDEQWKTFKALGTGWLVEKLNRAKVA